jgi:hypothetical protein
MQPIIAVTAKLRSDHHIRWNALETHADHGRTIRFRLYRRDLKITAPVKFTFEHSIRNPEMGSAFMMRLVVARGNFWRAGATVPFF